MVVTELSHNGAGPRISLEVRSGKPRFRIVDAGAVESAAQGSTSVADGQWHLLTGVRDVGSDKVRIYVDGVLQGEVTDGTTGTFTQANPKHLVGKSANSSADYFNGSIDEVQIFRWALGPKQAGLQPIISAWNYGGWLVRNDYSLYGWGQSQLFQHQRRDSEPIPTKLESSGVIDVAAGTYFTLFVKQDGSLWAGGGQNTYGQFGIGSVGEWESKWYSPRIP